MSFGRGSRSRIVLPRWAENILIVVLGVVAAGFVTSALVLATCALHAGCFK